MRQFNFSMKDVLMEYVKSLQYNILRNATTDILNDLQSISKLIKCWEDHIKEEQCNTSKRR